MAAIDGRLPEGTAQPLLHCNLTQDFLEILSHEILVDVADFSPQLLARAAELAHQGLRMLSKLGRADTQWVFCVPFSGILQRNRHAVDCTQFLYRILFVLWRVKGLVMHIFAWHD